MKYDGELFNLLICHKCKRWLLYQNSHSMDYFIIQKRTTGKLMSEGMLGFFFFLHPTFMVFIDVRKLNHYFLFSVLKEFFMLRCSLFLGPFTKLLGHKKDINSPPSLQEFYRYKYKINDKLLPYFTWIIQLAQPPVPILLDLGVGVGVGVGMVCIPDSSSSHGMYGLQIWPTTIV